MQSLVFCDYLHYCLKGEFSIIYKPEGNTVKKIICDIWIHHIPLYAQIQGMISLLPALSAVACYTASPGPAADIHPVVAGSAPAPHLSAAPLWQSQSCPL